MTLTALGNPGNMGFCIACFLRDTSGALGLHSAPVVQYFRPEIVGIVLGALIAAIAAKEFKGHGGSSPVLRFVLGAFVMIGALMFLGCPLRMVIRLGGGDLNALVGLVGFIAGILVGIVFLKKGFSLQRSYRQMKAEGAAFPLVLVGLYVGLQGLRRGPRQHARRHRRRSGHRRDCWHSLPEKPYVHGRRHPQQCHVP